MRIFDLLSAARNHTDRADEYARQGLTEAAVDEAERAKEALCTIQMAMRTQTRLNNLASRGMPGAPIARA